MVECLDERPEVLDLGIEWLGQSLDLLDLDAAPLDQALLVELVDGILELDGGVEDGDGVIGHVFDRVEVGTDDGDQAKRLRHPTVQVRCRRLEVVLRLHDLGSIDPLQRAFEGRSGREKIPRHTADDEQGKQ